MNPLIVEFYRDRARLWRWRARRSGRIVAESGEGYSRRGKAIKTLANLIAAIESGRVVFKSLAIIAVACLSSHLALANNSPRPASYRVQGGALVVTWTNLSEAHPWLVSYRHSLNQPWQWDTSRLNAVGGVLTVAVPMTAQQGFYRLWPAAPEQ